MRRDDVIAAGTLLVAFTGSLLLVRSADLKNLPFDTPAYSWLAVVGVALCAAKTGFLRSRHGPDGYPEEAPIYLAFSFVGFLVAYAASQSNSDWFFFVAIFAVWASVGGLTLDQGWGRSKAETAHK